MVQSVEQASPHPSMTQPFQLRPIHGKGSGLIATETIERGTRIIEEAPLLYVALNSKVDDDQYVAEMADKFDQLSDADAKVFDGLRCSLSKVNEYNGLWLARFRQKAMAKARAVSSSGTIDEDDLKAIDQLCATAIRRLVVFHTNCVGVTGLDPNPGNGVFETFSRLNHACNPNTARHFNLALGKLTVHAVRQVAKGEELTTSYIDVPARTSKCERASKLMKIWEIDCTCPACTGPTALHSEHRRAKMQELDECLTVYKDQQEQGMAGPDDAQEALVIAEEIRGLMHDEGVLDSQLAER